MARRIQEGMKTGDELIVLHHTKFKDNSIVLHTLSRRYGRRSFLVSVGKGGTMAMFLPLNILEADIRESPKTTLWRAGNFSAKASLEGIRSSVAKNAMTLFMSEVLYRTIHEDSSEEGLFDWCVSEILALDALEQDFSNFHLRFLLDLAAALGFCPSMEGLMPFAGSRSGEISALLKGSVAEAMLVPLTGSARSAIAEILLKYLSFHTESPIRIQSLSVLHDLFA